MAEAEAAAEQLDRDDDENERGEVADAALPNDYITGLNSRLRIEGRKACGCTEAHDFVIDSQGNDVTAQTCWQEDDARPSVGDLIEPGMIVETNYGTGPYMVASVSSYVLYGHYRCWSLSLIYPDRETGEYHDTKRDQRGTINELVADWSEGAPRFLKLFKANSDEVRIIGRGSKVDRKGQTSLL